MSDDEAEPLNGRSKKFRRQLSKNVHTFFGVNKDTCEEQQTRWRNRSLRLTGQHSITAASFDANDVSVGNMDTVDSPMLPSGQPVVSSVSFHQPSRQNSSCVPKVSFSVAEQHVSVQPSSAYSGIQRQASTVSNIGSRQDRLLRKRELAQPHKESISNMVMDCFKTLRVPEKKSRKPCHYSRSFTPKSMAVFCGEEIFSPRYGTITPPQTPVSYDRTPTMYDTCDSIFDSVFFDESVVEYQTETVPQHPASTSRTTPNRDPFDTYDPFVSAKAHLSPIESLSERDSNEASVVTPDANLFIPDKDSATSTCFDEVDSILTIRTSKFTEPSIDADTSYVRQKRRLQKGYPIDDTIPYIGIDQPDITISSKWINGFNGEDNSNRKHTGLGILGYFLNARYKSDAVRRKKELLENVTDKRAYFTWWITFVQTVIYFISVAVYGMAPFGIEERKITGEVIKPNLAIERVFYFEQENMWLGPRRADLIHMGAKFSPCMRRDQNIQEILDEAIKKERHTGCCIRNDGSGCIQTSDHRCSKILSTWHSNTDLSHGTVCGQDPRYCNKPASQGVYKWNETDFTRWPVCYSSSKSPESHMTCTINSRPCCVGILGNCIMTTREYCTFRRGYFHEEANLCSQVSCMGEICGMLSFLDPNKPAQFYRLWVSLFLHAGLIQLLISITFQLVIMRDIEKLAGWFRIMIIYLMCGVAGSLSSAIFLPYHVEAGPAGSQFGILACSFAELLQNCKLLVNPWKQIAKLCFILLVLFIFGLLPYVDNYAHLIGFLQGLLLSFVLLPNVMGGDGKLRKKMILIVISLLVSFAFFILLLILFYVVPVYNCPGCQYFNCIPFTDKFCQSMEVQIKEVLIKD